MEKGDKFHQKAAIEKHISVNSDSGYNLCCFAGLLNPSRWLTVAQRSLPFTYGNGSDIAKADK